MRRRDVALRVAELLLIGTLLLAGAQTASADGQRIALVVGNGAYRSVAQLGNPTNDARLMARTLGALGFTLIGGGAQLNLDKAGFDQAVRTFGQQLPGAEVALFYYAGHGMQVQGANWLVPVDANPARVQDLDFQMVDAGLVLKQMEGAGTKLNVVILDACRNNPFGGRGLMRESGGGLAQMRAPEGTLISYATQPGNIAQDGSGADSPYTLALVDAMQQKGLDVLRMFNRVGVEVKRSTGGAQLPWVSTSPIEGDFYFAGTAPADRVQTSPSTSSGNDVAVINPKPATPPQATFDPVKEINGYWRFPSGAACDIAGQARVGILRAEGGRLNFEWLINGRDKNYATERIDSVSGNTIYTTVVQDDSTVNSQLGHRIRYTVQPGSWTSEDLTTHQTAVHKRC